MKKKSIIITACVTTVIALGATAAVIYNNIDTKINKWSSLVYQGVKIEDIDLSGKTKAEAKALVSQKYSDSLLKNKVIITGNNKCYSLDYSKMNARYNIDETIDKAFSYGKNLSMLDKNNLINKPVNKVFKMEFSYDVKPLNNLLDTMEKEINSKPVNATLTLVGSKFTVTDSKDGAKLNKDELQKDVIGKLTGEVGKDVSVQAPIEVLKPTATSQTLKTVDTKISSFSTDFGSISSQERATNIILATKAINGKSLMPGESFSFNDVVGERTAAKGYQAAPVIIGNKVDSGLGGGICQVSTTLYGSLLRADVKSVERSHHTLPSHYVPHGLDATVSYGSLDYKFKNNLDYPIYLEGTTKNGILVFNIYSNSSLAKMTYEITINEYEALQPAATKYVDDPTLPLGQTQIDQNALVGFKVKVIRTAYQNGVKVGEPEVVTDDTYNAIQGIIKKGTKK